MWFFFLQLDPSSHSTSSGENAYEDGDKGASENLYDVIQEELGRQSRKQKSGEGRKDGEYGEEEEEEEAEGKEEIGKEVEDEEEAIYDEIGVLDKNLGHIEMHERGGRPTSESSNYVDIQETIQSNA